MENSPIMCRPAYPRNPSQVKKLPSDSITYQEGWLPTESALFLCNGRMNNVCIILISSFSDGGVPNPLR